ncbi:MAG: SUMF1/EgtB/PvdO family nonheme iron enzyme [Sediminispirochaetaceae bacterium]
MKKKKKSIEIGEVEPVRLKPFMGMQPGQYLTIAYAIALLLLLFLILILPGIRSNGARVSFQTAPSGAAVFVDERYIGSTPFDAFIPKGSHEVRIEKPYFAAKNETVRTPGRIFATLLFPRKMNYESSLAIEDRSGFLNWNFRQVAGWALVGSFYESYTYPRRSSSAVEEFIQGTGEAGSEELYDFMYMLTNNMNSPEIFTDIQNAYRLAVSTAASGDADFASLLNDMPFAGEADAELIELYSLLHSTEFQEEGTMSPEQGLIFDILRNRIDGLPFDDTYSRDIVQGDSLRVEGVSFLRLDPPRTVPVGNRDIALEPESIDIDQLNAFPHLEEIGPYYLSVSEISRSQFLAFTVEESKWSAENSDLLAEQELVDEGYLAFLEEDSSNPGLPVTNVSWYAAGAYCKWLQSKLPESLKDRYIVRLPTEAEWEYAARVNGEAKTVDRSTGAGGPESASYLRAGKAGFTDLIGNVWEWSDNWYFPSDTVDGRYGLSRPVFDGMEKAVRGGSWIQSRDEVPVWLRASQPPAWCSEFVGFRVVLAPAAE